MYFFQSLVQSCGHLWGDDGEKQAWQWEVLLLHSGIQWPGGCRGLVAWAPGSRGRTSLAHWHPTSDSCDSLPLQTELNESPKDLVSLSSLVSDYLKKKRKKRNRKWTVFLMSIINTYFQKGLGMLLKRKLLWPKSSWKCSIVLLMARIHYMTFKIKTDFKTLGIIHMPTWKWLQRKTGHHRVYDYEILTNTTNSCRN